MLVVHVWIPLRAQQVTSRVWVCLYPRRTCLFFCSQQLISSFSNVTAQASLPPRGAGCTICPYEGLWAVTRLDSHSPRRHVTTSSRSSAVYLLPAPPSTVRQRVPPSHCTASPLLFQDALKPSVPLHSRLHSPSNSNSNSLSLVLSCSTLVATLAFESRSPSRSLPYSRCCAIMPSRATNPPTSTPSLSHP